MKVKASHYVLSIEPLTSKLGYNFWIKLQKTIEISKNLSSKQFSYQKKLARRCFFGEKSHNM